LAQPPKMESPWNIVLAILYVLLYTYNERTGNFGKGLRARESWPAGGFRGRAKTSAGTYAGVAGILQADQEGSDVALDADVLAWFKRQG
jgi:hypothetical protein